MNSVWACVWFPVCFGLPVSCTIPCVVLLQLMDPALTGATSEPLSGSFHTKSTHYCFEIHTGLYSRRSYIVMWVWWWVGNYCRTHGSPWWVSLKIKVNLCILKIWADWTVDLNNATAGLRLPMAAFHEVCNDAVISMIRVYCIPTTNKDSCAYIFTCSQKVRTWEKSKFR